MPDFHELVGNGDRIELRGPAPTTLDDDDVFAVSTRAFEQQFDESILDAINIDKWRLGSDVDAEFRRIKHEIREADRYETANERQIREEFFPRFAVLEAHFLGSQIGLRP